MTYERCIPVNVSSFGSSLVDICNATMFLAFISTLELAIDRNNVIGGACERVKPVKRTDDKYDFIVVGGGAGGAVVASRLSENPKHKVLLLEAGLDEPPGCDVPSFSGQFLNSNIVWNYVTTNETSACRSRNGSCPCPSGKNLGGNTAHNDMMYLRGNQRDFNNWAALGIEGWAWEEVKKFHIKSEDNGEINRVGTKHHGTGGPLSIERLPYLLPMGFAALDAAKEIGYGVSEDLNGVIITGFSWVQSTSKNEVKRSTESAFLRPARHRKNLHVSLNSFVTKVLIEKKTAVGIEYYKDGKFYTVYVTKEVIVPAGAMNSPQILLLSGIGPKEHLKSVGVPVILDLPGVGQNFRDHPATALTFTVNEPDLYMNDRKVAAEYVKYQTGLMSAAETAVVGVLATDMTECDYPDMQIYLDGYSTNCTPGEVGAFRSNGKRTTSALVSYLHPKSRGTVTLASKDPFDLPILRAAYLEDSNDLEALIKGMKIVPALTESESLKPYNLTMVPVEACVHHGYLSDEYFACVAQSDNYALYHFVGSRKMGPVSDPLAVVNSQRKVYGIKGLRVADTSIIPRATSGNTQARAIMIRERAAVFIEKYWC